MSILTKILREARRQQKRRDLLLRQESVSAAEILRRFRREKRNRKRPPGMAPALVESPKGPLPMQGGAAAPLEFDQG